MDMGTNEFERAEKTQNNLKAKNGYYNKHDDYQNQHSPMAPLYVAAVVEILRGLQKGEKMRVFIAHL